MRKIVAMCGCGKVIATNMKDDGKDGCSVQYIAAECAKCSLTGDYDRPKEKIKRREPKPVKGRKR